MLSAGYDHACALLNSGSAKCWGKNIQGQLGDATNTSKSVPTPVSNLTDATSIGAGYNHTCSLKSGGTVVCWGYNNVGQLGDGTSSSSIDPTKNSPHAVTALSSVAAIAIAADYGCALKSDGTVACWGGAPNGTTTTPASVSGVSGAIKVTTGGEHACALKSDGTLLCWGKHIYGQLGNGNPSSSTIYSAQTVKADGLGTVLSGVIDVSAGDRHTCALLSDKTVKCWGNNNSLQSGSNSATEYILPQAVAGVSNAIAVSAGVNHTCALITGGQVMCWGNNDHGQLGDGGTTSRHTPAAVSSLTDAAAITAAGVLRSALGDIASDHSYTCALRTNGDVMCWGSNTESQLGDNSTTERPSSVSTNAGAVFWH